ncbi:MAG: hypothetical protein NC548_53695 [Lachnospiraceae bacterium]|nr:hypothetical protein [Lachnospiraceae bacterium]
MDVRQIAINFLKSLTAAQRKKVRGMLEHGIVCGADFARENCIEPAQLSEELKLIFAGK